MKRGYSFIRRSTRKERLTFFGLIGLGILVLLVLLVIVIRHIYDQNLKAVSNNPKAVLVTINNGLNVNQIADLLHKDGLIRSAWSFEYYARAHEVRDQLQAGTYDLSPSQDVPTIISIIAQGKVETRLVTIIPGKRLDQVRATLINDGFSPANVDQALQPSQYASLPIIADKPADASLEGLLFPDSFEKNADTDPSVIISESLTEMGQKLTPDLQAAFAREGLTSYQGITLASIVQQEVSSASDQAQVAQVFLKRLGIGMQLGSDVTAYYGSAINGLTPSLSYDSPYNTLIHNGLPPTPIGTVSEQALQATAHPASTDWLYFVSGDNGTTYFSNTIQQQQANTAQYCHKLCASN